MTRRACPDCLEEVIWARTVNNKYIALNPEPDPAGNQGAYRDGTQTFRTRQLGDDQEPLAYERRYMPHVATCAKRRKPAELPPNVISIGRAPSKRSPPVTGHPRRA